VGAVEADGADARVVADAGSLQKNGESKLSFVFFEEDKVVRVRGPCYEHVSEEKNRVMKMSDFLLLEFRSKKKKKIFVSS
jgi:hypothetical protein